MSFVSQSDFKGKFQITENKFTDITPYIDRYEGTIFIELMGKELSEDFINDPTDSKWDDFKAIGFGIKSLIVGLVYFEYVRDLPYRMTNKGMVYQMDENANQVIHAHILRQRYNECINDWREMQKYLRGEFDEFAGKRRKYMID